MYCLKMEMKSPAVANSIIRIGKIGGYIGGIPVINHEINGQMIVKTNTYFQDKNILAIIMGKNIGKKAGPRPTK